MRLRCHTVCVREGWWIQCNLYNEIPAWLVNTNVQLDAAVAGAYGSSPDLSDDQILANLLELNLSRKANA